MEFELATTRELIEEIRKRSTFAGLILWSPDEHREDGQTHKDFNLFTSVDDEQTVKLLEIAMTGIKK